MKKDIKYRKRLEKLATHLESGKLGHKKFDFSVWNRTKDRNDAEPYSCGYAGCAIGECPIVFPRDWKFTGTGGVGLKVDHDYEDEDAVTFFGITRSELYHLFVPDLQHIDLYGGKQLGVKATRKQVAKNIRIFIEKFKSGELEYDE
jgi:hypothetical protein